MIEINEKGIFDRFLRFAVGVKQKVESAKRKVDKFIANVIGSIISVENNKSISKKSNKNGASGVAVENGGSITTSSTIIGNSNSIIKISINNNDNDIFSSTIGLSINSPIISYKAENGLTSSESSVNATIIGDTYSINMGRNMLDSYIGIGVSAPITNNLSESAYIRISMNIALPIIIYATAHGVPSVFGTGIPAFSN